MLSEVSRKLEAINMCVPEKDHIPKVLYHITSHDI